MNFPHPISPPRLAQFLFFVKNMIPSTQALALQVAQAQAQARAIAQAQQSRLPPCLPPNPAQAYQQPAPYHGAPPYVTPPRPPNFGMSPMAPNLMGVRLPPPQQVPYRGRAPRAAVKSTPTCRVFVGVEFKPGLRVRVAGPEDSYLKHIAATTNCVVSLHGKGSGSMEMQGNLLAESPEPMHILLASVIALPSPQE